MDRTDRLQRLVGIDSDDLAVAEQLAQTGEVQRATAEARAAFDDPVGPPLSDQLLVDSQIERAIERLIAEPGERDGMAAFLPAPVVEVGNAVDETTLIR